MALLEIACFHVESVKMAATAGAHRAELCRDKFTEGLTPFLKDIEEALDASIPLNVMIRPRAGSYVYNTEEMEVLLNSIRSIRQLPVNGLVFGSLTADGCIHMDQNRSMIDAAAGLPCTFHRAFDEVINRSEGLEELISCGYSTVLTSCGKSRAIDASVELKQLIDQAGSRITVMPGGGVRSSHISELVQLTGAAYVHSSAITSEGELPDPDEMKALLLGIK